MKRRKKQKFHNGRQPIASIVIAGTGMAVAGGIGAVICPLAMPVFCLAALLVAAVGESCKGSDGDADGWGG